MRVGKGFRQVMQRTAKKSCEPGLQRGCRQVAERVVEGAAEIVAHAVHLFGCLGRLSTHILRHLWDRVQIKGAHLLEAGPTVWLFSGATLP